MFPFVYISFFRFSVCLFCNAKHAFLESSWTPTDGVIDLDYTRKSQCSIWWESYQLKHFDDSSNICWCGKIWDAENIISPKHPVKRIHRGLVCMWMRSLSILALSLTMTDSQPGSNHPQRCFGDRWAETVWVPFSPSAVNNNLKKGSGLITQSLPGWGWETAVSMYADGRPSLVLVKQAE